MKNSKKSVLLRSNQPALVGTTVLFAILIASCDSKTSFQGTGGKVEKRDLSKNGATDDATAQKTNKTPGPNQDPVTSTSVAPSSSPMSASAPVVTMSSSAPDITNDVIPVTITVDRDHVPLRAEQVKVTGGFIEDFTKTGNNYSFRVNPSGEGPVTIVVEKGTVKDLKGVGNADTVSIVKTFARTGLSYTADALTSFTEKSVYVVNSAGTAYKIGLDAAANYPIQSWTGSGGGGHRTFVSAIGLLIGTNGGKIYRVADDVPTAGVAQLIYSAGAASNSRTCVTAFRDPATGKEYIGAGYHDATNRKFVKIPIDLTKSKKIDDTQAVIYDAGQGSWAYSCYTDQGRNIFWSKDIIYGGNIAGINMITGAVVPLSSAPNAAHKFTIPNVITVDLAGSSQSYAMSGGGAGYLLSGPSVYTSALDSATNTVFVSIGSRLVVADLSCFTTDANCQGTNKLHSYNTTTTGIVKPLSSMNNGSILAIERNAPTGKSSVFTIGLVDNTDRSKGLSITKIKEVDGDAYMYTDFTGATTYARTVNARIDLKSAPNWTPNPTLASPSLTWRSEGGDGDTWRGLSMSIRCFNGANNNGTFTAVSNVQNAGTHVNVSAPSCTGSYDTVEIKIESDGSADFSRTRSVEFFVRR